MRTAMILALLSSPAWSQEWTRFRGPNGTGISSEKGVPATWTEKDFRWRVPIAGESHSQPVIWGDKLFLESAMTDGKERMLICINKQDGKELWVKKYAMATHAKHKLNSYASSTPTVDKDRVYASFADREKFLVKAWDHSGKELWSTDLGPFISQHGLGASPIIYEDKLIVTNDQDADSFIIALNLTTGKPVWKCPRKGVEQNTAYGTPCILERKGAPPQILTTSYAHGISGLDPKTGAMLWEAKVFDKRSVASPVVSGDLVFGSCGSGAFKDNFVAAVKLGGRGDVTSSHLAYTVKDKESPYYVPTPIAAGGRLFMISDKGFASCIEASTGRVVWKENVSGSFCGSPVLVDGRMYCPSEKGEMVVLDASESFKVVARNPMGEGSRSTPCVEGGRIYVKTFTHLVCVGAK